MELWMLPIRSFCRFRPDTTLTFVNQACCRLWNRERNQLIGERVLAVVPESMRASIWEQIEETVHARESRTRHPRTNSSRITACIFPISITNSRPN